MPQITALKAQVKNKNRANVYLDGEFAFGLVLIEAIRLKVGQVLTEADIARLKNADDYEKAYEKTLNFLSFRARSESEIRKYLKKKELPEEQADRVVERLRNAGLIDDKAFAGMWVENRAAFKPKGKRALKAELRAKGVPAAEIEAAIENVDETQAAEKLAMSRAEKIMRAKPAKMEFKKKLFDFLARRGFGYDTISDAVERAWREHGVDTSNESED
jgi:regulatory protein